MKTTRYLMFFLFFLGPLALFAQDLVTLVGRVQPAVVSIGVFDENDEVMATGTGFFINESGHVLSNFHVLKGAHSAKVRLSDGTIYPVAEVLGGDEVADLIWLRIDAPKKTFPYLTIKREIPSVGERILVLGHPLGLEFTVSDGIVSAVRDVPEFGKVIQMTAPISPGSSGSPVMNMRGEVIGVATFQFLDGQNLNFAMPGELVHRLMGKELPQTLAGAFPQDNPESPESLFAQGMAYLWGGNCVSALGYFEEARRLKHDDYDLLFSSGYCYLQTGEYIKAIDALAQSLQQRKSPEAYYNLGLAFLQRGWSEQAVDAFQKALALDTTLADAHNNLAAAFNNLGKYDEALAACQQALEVNPRLAEAYYNTGVSYGHKGDLEKAVLAYKTAIQVEPRYPEAYLALGATLLDLARYEEAAAAFSATLRYRQDDAKAHFGLGAAYAHLGEEELVRRQVSILQRLDETMAAKLSELMAKQP